MAQAPLFQPEPFGPYLLTAHLGRGGMADVFKARVEGVAGFARSVVVKRILKIHTDDPQFVDMFINEAKIAARLSHPNIAQVYELGEVDGELFMAMEYVRGLDLLRLLRAAAAQTGDSALPPLVAAYVAREVCRGLGHAHEHLDENGAPRPIIHRDISPQNVMVSFDGQIKVVDFGIAKAVTAFQEATMTGSLKGKFGYMAPEQIDTGICTAQTDLFSVGVMLHEVLTGRRLFKGQTDYETMTRVKSAEVPAPSQLNPTIAGATRHAADLDRVVLTALQRNPAQRYPRASQMARDLDMILQDARFSIEDMVAWLRQVIPPGQRDEAESQVMQLSRGTPSHTGSPGPTGTGAQRVSRSRGGSGVYSRAPYDPQKDSLGDMNGLQGSASVSRLSRPLGAPVGQLGAVGPTGTGAVQALPPAQGPGQGEQAARRRILIAGAGVLGLLVLTLVGGSVYLRRPPQPGPGTDPGSPPRPEPLVPARPDKTIDKTPDKAPDKPEVARRPDPPAATETAVPLRSDPPGARVWRGARLLGETPLTVNVPAEGLEVQLLLEGRPELRYTLRPSDSAGVTLRLGGDGKKGRRRDKVDDKRPTEPGAKDPGPKRLKVKALDDDDNEPRGTPAVD